MNAFFASVEQLDRPEWGGRPLADTNGRTGTRMIICSDVARAHGIKTGMRLKEWRKLCPVLIQCPARPQRYVEVSTRIMNALQDVSPEMEVFSVDGAFLDDTRCQRLFGPLERIEQLTKRKVFDVSGLLCSVGVSGDKTTATANSPWPKRGCSTVPPCTMSSQRRGNPSATARLSRMRRQIVGEMGSDVMCGGVYLLSGWESGPRFSSQACATLPVKTRVCVTTRLPWGQRQYQLSKLPLGGLGTAG